MISSSVNPLALICVRSLALQEISFMLNPHHFRGDAVAFYTTVYDKRKGEEK
jgi:hypothetical protein